MGRKAVLCSVDLVEGEYHHSNVFYISLYVVSINACSQFFFISVCPVMKAVFNAVEEK